MHMAPIQFRIKPGPSTMLGREIKLPPMHNFLPSLSVLLARLRSDLANTATSFRMVVTAPVQTPTQTPSAIPAATRRCATAALAPYCPLAARGRRPPMPPAWGPCAARSPRACRAPRRCAGGRAAVASNGRLGRSPGPASPPAARPSTAAAPPRAPAAGAAGVRPRRRQDRGPQGSRALPGRVEIEIGESQGSARRRRRRCYSRRLSISRCCHRHRGCRCLRPVVVLVVVGLVVIILSSSMSISS